MYRHGAGGTYVAMMRRRSVSPPAIIGSFAYARADNVTPPTHVAGDKLLCFAFTQAVSAQPDLGGGWTDLAISLGSNAPALRAAYKACASGSETCSGFTDAQQIYCGTLRNAATIAGNGGWKMTNSTDATISWLGLTLGSISTLVIGIALCAVNSDPALRSDLTELANNTLAGGQGINRLGWSNGLVTTWGSTTSAKTAGASQGRAISFEVAVQ